MTSDSRERMVRSAAALIRTRGLSATSFSDVLADSGAPRGSIYHHFPDGKRQLAAEAVRLSAGTLLARQGACPPTGAPGEVLAWFVRIWRELVTGSESVRGCTLAGCAIDTAPGEDDDLAELIRDTFRAWSELLAGQFTAAGLPADRARPVAVAVLAAVEGALILCRAEGGVGPLDTVSGELARLVVPPPP